eukprot:TRINITY_DN179_c0_g1_i6.p1 TRINITY_DN179_c0_g1~~TRINITY_DN179_c0_g1_i6.p1  ORF type:complete len:320 (-),score=95.05 TRINITY_DN179_c0_g1_i6:115-999(-)
MALSGLLSRELSGVVGDCGNGGAGVDSDRGLPSIEHCKRLLDECDVPANIREHSLKVSMLATNLVAHLKNSPACQGVDPSLVAAGGALHDIRKADSLRSGEDHAVTGGELLRKQGFTRVAQITEQHLYINDFDPNGPLLPEEVVCYVDKRVLHQEVVSLHTRKVNRMKQIWNENGCDIRKCLPHWQNVEVSFAQYEQIERKLQNCLSVKLDTLFPEEGAPVRIKWNYEGEDIYIAGDFTEWVPMRAPKREIVVRLLPGTYAYKFVVDYKWVYDVLAPQTKDSSGNVNNIIVVCK